MIATATLNPAGDKVLVDAPFRLAKLVKEVPGSRFSKGGTWTVPATHHAMVQLYGNLGPGHLEFDDVLLAKIASWKEDEAARQALRERAMTPGCWDEGLDDCLRDARPYQVAALRFGQHAGSWVLGDDMGVGKTLTAIAWMGSMSSLVVCPKAVQTSWLTSLNRWAPYEEHVLLTGSAVARRKLIERYRDSEAPGALIVSYNQLPLHSRLAGWGGAKLTEAEAEPKELNDLGFRTVVADEAHRLFNPKTKWTRAFWALGDAADRRLVMTGTPSESSPLDLWALLRAADPKSWASRSKFQDFYCATEVNPWGGVESIALRPERREEFHRLVNHTFVRRTKALVLPFLPPKVRLSRAVEMPPKLRKQYTDLAKQMTAELESGTLTLTDPLVLHARLVQAASATLEVTGSTENADGTWSDQVRMVEPAPKLDEMLQVLEDLGGEPLAVLARSRQLLDLAAARLQKLDIPYSSVVGGMSPEEIGNATGLYNSGDVRVILISLGAGAEGLSLTRGSTCLFLDKSYRQLENRQGEDRLHGIGRGDHAAGQLTIIELTTLGTVEERRAEKLRDKDEMSEQLFGADDLRNAITGAK
jgi:SNF2 family DNA or RNA helicase